MSISEPAVEYLKIQICKYFEVDWEGFENPPPNISKFTYEDLDEDFWGDSLWNSPKDGSQFNYANLYMIPFCQLDVDCDAEVIAIYNLECAKTISNKVAGVAIYTKSNSDLPAYLIHLEDEIPSLFVFN